MTAPAIVIAAEAMTLLWFAAYLGLARAFAREGAGQRAARSDPTGRALVRSVQLAFAAGLGAVVVLTALRILGG
jgi:hypothetical protein